MKKRSLTIFLITFLGIVSVGCGQAMAAQQNDLICYKGECWQEDGLTRLSGKGCPTPTLFVETSLKELKSYVAGAKKFGLTQDQVKRLQYIYEDATTEVGKVSGQLKSTTKLLVSEMTKEVPDQKEVNKLIDEIEKYCWEMVAKLANDVHAARSVVK